MNIASIARKETRKTKYNLQQSVTPIYSIPSVTSGTGVNSHDHLGRGVRSLFHSSRSVTTGGGGGIGIGTGTGLSSHLHPSASVLSHDFDTTEHRLRDNLLRQWAEQLPIPTRPLRLTIEEMSEDQEWNARVKGRRSSVISQSSSDYMMCTTQDAIQLLTPLSSTPTNVSDSSSTPTELA